MGVLDRLLRKKREALTIEHPLWGRERVELLVDAGEDGPTVSQEEAFRRFERSREELLPRCLEALAGLRRDMAMAPAPLAVSGLTIPSLGAEKGGKLWTLWFDCEGDEDFWYGVQSDDGWRTLSPFADD